jgi:hypothetical protein
LVNLPNHAWNHDPLLPIDTQIKKLHEKIIRIEINEENIFHLNLYKPEEAFIDAQAYIKTKCIFGSFVVPTNILNILNSYLTEFPILITEKINKKLYFTNNLTGEIVKICFIINETEFVIKKL